MTQILKVRPLYFSALQIMVMILEPLHGLSICTSRCASSDLPPGEGYMTKEDYSGYHFDPEEDEGNLSDLDPEEISEYIATDTEVEWSS